MMTKRLSLHVRILSIFWLSVSRERNVMKFRTLSFLFLLSLFTAIPAFATNTDLLPSQGLEQRVDFWKKIYTQYGADDIVIHDRIYVNLIYDVVASGDENSAISGIQSALQDIKANLQTPENLSTTSAPVFDAIVAQGLTLSNGLLDDLLDNIHTQIGIKERFRDGVVRSGRYVERFRQIMAIQGVPQELALLPLVESSFQNARSKAGAVGLWQFTSSTGRIYMQVNSRVDDRLDPIKSSEAAARLLRDNFAALGTWPLAITAYNHGRGGMLQAQREVSSDLTEIIDEYRGPVFGYASMNFYSEFLAAVEVYENYSQYFGELVLDTPDSLPTERPIQIAAAKPSKAPAKSATNSKSAAKKPATVAASKYKVQNGDTLFEIAKRFGTSIRELMDKNKLNNAAIYAGQVLLVK